MQGCSCGQRCSTQLAGEHTQARRAIPTPPHPVHPAVHAAWPTCFAVPDFIKFQEVVDLVREYNALGKKSLAIMLDTKGPEVRPATFRGFLGGLLFGVIQVGLESRVTSCTRLRQQAAGPLEQHQRLLLLRQHSCGRAPAHHAAAALELCSEAWAAWLGLSAAAAAKMAAACCAPAQRERGSASRECSCRLRSARWGLTNERLQAAPSEMPPPPLTHPLLLASVDMASSRQRRVPLPRRPRPRCVQVRSGDLHEPLELAAGDIVTFTIVEGEDGKGGRISGGCRGMGLGGMGGAAVDWERGGCGVGCAWLGMRWLCSGTSDLDVPSRSQQWE